MRIRQTFVVLATISVFATVAAAEQPAPSASKAAPETQKAAAQPQMEQAPALELAGVAVCKAVENREPVGDAESFPSDIGTLWCFTDVRNAEQPTQIYHRWYVGEKMVNEIPIHVNGPRWRCWSQKTIPASWSGDCRVEIVTEDGDVLGTDTFHLEPVESASKPAAESAG